MNSKLLVALFASPLLSAALPSVAHAASCAPYGLIGEKYAQYTAQLGACLDNEASDGAGGRIEAFQYGYIDWDGTSSQAYAVWGLVAQRWSSLGLAAGYGHPTDDEASETGGAYNLFTNGGSILWHQGAAAAYEVHGEIRQLYCTDGCEHGDLGFPTSNEQDSGGVDTSYFQNGWIEFRPKDSSTILHVYNDRFAFNVPSISFSGGVPVGSSSPLAVTIYSDGNWIFSGGFHVSSDFDPQVVNTAFTIGGVSTGDVYSFTRTSTLNVTQMTDNWTETGNNPAITSGWAGLESEWNYAYEASTSLDLGSIWSGIKAAYPYAATVVGIVGPLL